MGDMFKVFEVDVCFDSYASNIHYVGAKSIQDLLEHFSEIYSDDEYTITEETFKYDKEEYGDDIKIGDIIRIPYFTESERKEFDNSLDPNNHFPRITEVSNMYTDTPYTILSSWGYME